ncbi:MAG: PP2C family protein-serine/threonine phosphatase [Planctomycetota bacterium]|jgi:sigma-B regulation protein RsbU (phosphoserine phosphatase)
MSQDNTNKEQCESNCRLECSGLWGGIRNRNLDVTAGKVITSIYSSACDGGKGGDIYYFGVCKDDRITRLAIADVVGHGQAVADVSQFVYDSLRTHMCDLDSGNILGSVNQLVSARGLEAMTTAAIIAYDSEEGEASVSYAGHPPVLYRRMNDKEWSSATPSEENVQGDSALINVPLAIAPDALYGNVAIPMASGDRLFVYTDGITEACTPQGELFGHERLKDILDANCDVPLSELKAVVLRALHKHTQAGLSHDDVTLIALEIS